MIVNVYKFCLLAFNWILKHYTSHPGLLSYSHAKHLFTLAIRIEGVLLASRLLRSSDVLGTRRYTMPVQLVCARNW
jgi:hypothetical protein